jgi:tetratricopeptide (TPR) repeat protein
MVISLLLALQIAATAPAPAATLMEGLGELHHPIATDSEEAQKFFDQGLTLIYAFNHDEAIRSFRRAAELDPKSPMPWWGIAYALGPNINSDVDPNREKAAYEAVQQALKLSENAPANEKAYVTALVKRYSADPKADLKAMAMQYRQAMHDVTVAYPNDLDASVLYVESIMDMHPWQMWTQDGGPAEGTIEAINVLENVLKYDKNHIGANHYYIHCVEASISPERALESADRMKTLVPAAGHLVHMPSHIYMHTGDYIGAVKANEAALDADRKYIDATKPSGMYPVMYYNHNLDFLASAAMMTGEFAKASKAADEVVANALAGVNDMPMLEPFAAKKMFVLLRFAKWDDMLQVPAPDPKLKMLTAVWHFGRGVAMAKKGNAAGADQEKAAYNTAKRTVAADAMWGLNKASAIFAVADGVLDARIWLAKKDLEQSISAWKRAAAAQDKLAYDEPEDWYYPVRESLEAALLYAHRLDETERVFRQELEHNPENPRTLFIQYQFYTITDDKDMSLVYRRRFSDAWSNADVDLKLDDY